MALLDDLDFAQQRLAVAYRASDTPQVLTFQLRTARPSEDPQADILLDDLVDTINRGGAGSDVFPPQRGAAALLSAVDPAGPEYTCSIEACGVAPVFLRNVVEALRDVGGLDNPVVAMSVFGSLAPDGGPLSAREAQVRAWLDDPRAYVRAWPSPGFPVFEREAMGAKICLRLDARVDAALEQELRAIVFRWLSATSHYVNQYGEPILNDPVDMARLMPRFARARNEFRVIIEEFTRSVAARAMLVNMLARFHATTAPIAEAEIAL